MKCLAFFLYKYDAYGILSKIIYPDNTTEEFRKDILMDKLTGNQKWQLWCAEEFLNKHDNN